MLVPKPNVAVPLPLRKPLGPVIGAAMVSVWPGLTWMLAPRPATVLPRVMPRLALRVKVPLALRKPAFIVNWLAVKVIGGVPSLSSLEIITWPLREMLVLPVLVLAPVRVSWDPSAPPGLTLSAPVPLMGPDMVHE